MRTFVKEISRHLKEDLIPFWEGLKDGEYGGYYGWLGYDLKLDQKSEKGCILNSRILWFFSSACRLLGWENLKADAEHAYRFLRECCLDGEYGGIYWSLTYDGQVKDDTKHTYNQAFAIYALSSYYEMSKDPEALALARSLFRLIEEKCRDEYGYLEAFDRRFQPADNEKLSENGVVDTTRVWWVQAEAIVGFVNGWEKNPERTEYLEAAERIWNYICDKVIDKRNGSEWFWAVDKDGDPLEKPIVEPWKCPYHNGRMCMEVIRRLGDDT